MTISLPQTVYSLLVDTIVVQQLNTKHGFRSSTIKMLKSYVSCVYLLSKVSYGYN